MLFWCCFSL